MTEHTEKDVLMKCTKCGYEEEVPRWLIDELFPNEPEENYMMHCPECDHKMIVKKIIQQLKTNTKCRLFSIVLFVVPHNQQIVTIRQFFTYRIPLFRNQNLNIAIVKNL